MKKIFSLVLFILFSLYMICGVGVSHVNAATFTTKDFSYDDEVWERIPGVYSDWKNYSKTGGLGTISVDFLILRNKNKTPNYDYYSVFQVAKIYLKEDYEDPIMKTYNNNMIDQVWLNGGLTLTSDVNAYNSSFELYEYGPEQLFPEKTYKTEVSAGVEFGVGAEGTSLGGDISATSSESWIYTGRDIEDKSRPTDGIVKTRYRYHSVEKGETEPRCSEWWYCVDNFEDVGVKELMYSMDYNSSWDTFNNTITERQSFVIKVPKNTPFVVFKLEAYFTQLWIDYAWVNENEIHQDKAFVIVSISTC